MDFLCNHDWQINALSEKFISGVDLLKFGFRLLYARRALVCHVTTKHYRLKIVRSFCCYVMFLMSVAILPYS